MLPNRLRKWWLAVSCCTSAEWWTVTVLQSWLKMSCKRLPLSLSTDPFCLPFLIFKVFLHFRSSTLTFRWCLEKLYLMQLTVEILILHVIWVEDLYGLLIDNIVVKKNVLFYVLVVIFSNRRIMPDFPLWHFWFVLFFKLELRDCLCVCEFVSKKEHVSA